MAHYSPTAPAVVAAGGNEPAPAVDEEGRVVAEFETVWVPVFKNDCCGRFGGGCFRKTEVNSLLHELIDPVNPSLLVGGGSSGGRALFGG